MMKRTLIWIGLFAVLLSGCAATVTPSGGVCRLWDRSLTSSHSADAQSVICDDEVTRLVYGFSHNAWLEYTRVALIGQDGAQLYLSPRLPPARLMGSERYEIILPSGTAPLSAERTFRSQSVVVVPNPSVIGYTEVELRAYDASGYVQVYRLATLPVVDRCGD